MFTDGTIAELVQLTSSMTKPKFSFVIVILQPVSVHSAITPVGCLDGVSGGYVVGES